jgi:hypothetical protein
MKYFQTGVSGYCNSSSVAQHILEWLGLSYGWFIFPTAVVWKSSFEKLAVKMAMHSVSIDIL